MNLATQQFQILSGGSQNRDLNTTNANLLKNKKLQEKYTGSWLWRTLAAMVDMSSFEPSPIKLAAQLNVTVEQVVEALEGLVELGIIRRTTDGFSRVFKNVYFSDRQLNPKALLVDHMLVSTQISGRLDAFNNKGQFYRTGFVATNRETMNNFCEKLDALMREFLEESSKAEADTVFAMTFSGVEVLAKTVQGE